MDATRKVPICVYVLEKLVDFGAKKRIFYQTSTLVLTFVAYVAFHMSRRPLAVVKNALNQNCSKLVPPKGMVITNATADNWCDWAPFDGSDANQLLGVMDTSFLIAYALCMFASGVLAERVNLRYYLSIGMLLSGVFTYILGLAYYLDIHSLTFFILLQILAGAAQSTGWPSVVACVGNWFGKARRGLIFGLWNAHLYVGNVLGAYVAGYFVVTSWGMAYMVPGAIVGIIGFILFLFLVPHPEDVDLPISDHHGTVASSANQAELPRNAKLNPSSLNAIITSPDRGILTEKSPLTGRSPASCTPVSEQSRQAITFFKAIKIPGVLEFSLCLFFSKLVSYTFLFWLPRYLDHTTKLGSQHSAYLSIAFDVGGIFGGVIAGLISDQTGSSAMTCVGFLGLAVPGLFIYENFGSDCPTTNVILQLIVGALVNGPYGLITTAVSAELGTHHSIYSSSKALSTVTAIIDGTGSIGAALGPLLAGVISSSSWKNVFIMMMVSDFLAMISLLRLAKNELNRLCQKNYGWCSFLPFYKSQCCRCC